MNTQQEQRYIWDVSNPRVHTEIFVCIYFSRYIHTTTGGVPWHYRKCMTRFTPLRDRRCTLCVSTKEIQFNLKKRKTSSLVLSSSLTIFLLLSGASSQRATRVKETNYIFDIFSLTTAANEWVVHDSTEISLLRLSRDGNLLLFIFTILMIKFFNPSKCQEI